MKNLILAALLTFSPVTGMQDSLATAAATAVSMDAAQQDLFAEAHEIEAAIKAQAQAPVLSEPFEVVITFYVPSRRNGSLTASGVYATEGTIAADASVPFETQYYIPGLTYVKSDGIFTVQDRGSAVYGNVVDVFLPVANPTDPATKAALQVGRFKTIAYRVLTGEEAALQRANQKAVAGLTEEALSTAWHQGASIARDSTLPEPLPAPDALPLPIPIDQNTAADLNLTPSLQVQRRSKNS